MPEGTKVHRCYKRLTSENVSRGKAVRVCQESTGQALATGKPPKGKKKHHSSHGSSHNPGY